MAEDGFEAGECRRKKPPFSTSAGYGRYVKLRIIGDQARIREVLDIWFNDEEFGGCIFLNAASEFPNPNDPVHQAAANHKIANRAMVRDLAAEANAEDPEAFADVYMMLFEGALVLRQVYGRNDAARTAFPAVENLIAEQL